MDAADQLLKKIFSWVKLKKQHGHELHKLANELEKTSNVTKVVGISVSVGGAAAMTASAIGAVSTGGAAVLFLCTAVVIGSVLGFTTNTASGSSDVGSSSKTEKEAKEIGVNIRNLEEGIQKQIETLKEEGKKKEKRVLSCRELSPEDYVAERILRSMAKRERLMINDSVSLGSVSSNLARTVAKQPGAHLAPLLLSLVSKLSDGQSRKKLVCKSLPELCASMRTQAAGGKAEGQVEAVGLAFSVPELIVNCKNPDDYRTEIGRSLRKNAEDILAASEQLQGELDEIEKLFKKLARVKSCIENRERSRDDRKILFEFAKENCRDKTVQQWLKVDENSKVFSRLADMCQLLKAKIDEEEQNNHSNTVDITFLAHGAITDCKIPASRLLPLPTLTDVVLYSPWNCNLSVDAAYDIAVGIMQPRHRKFYHSEGKGNEKPEPRELPDEWNSMKKAKDKNQKIPNILLSPVGGPKDDALKEFKRLENTYGKAGINHIVIPFILPELSKEDITLPVVTLALSLVLMFSRFQATLRLTACLGKYSEQNKLDVDALKQQYACAVDGATMTSSLDWTNYIKRQYESWKKFIFG